MNGKNDANKSPVNESQVKNKQTTSLIESVRRKFRSKDIGRQFWMPDSTSINCFDCATKFTTIRRRHHCRICGQIFCSNCCNEMIDSRLIISQDSTSNTITTSGLLRVCKYCSNRLQNVVADKFKGDNISNSELNDQIRSPNHQLSNSSENRKFSTSSIGDIVRFAKASLDTSDSVMIDQKKDHNYLHQSTPKSYRPSSAASASHDNRFIFYDEILSDNNSLLSCSFDNFQSMLDELDETINAREPFWVKEIVEEARIKQANKSSLLIEDKENNNSIHNDQISEDITGPSYNRSNDNTDIGEFTRTSLNDPSCDKIDAQLDIEKSSDKPSNQTLFNDTLIYLDRFFDRNLFFTNQESKPEKDINENDLNAKKISIEKIDKSELPILLINNIYDNHMEKILNQILKDEKMSLEWHPILNKIAKQIADTIKLPQFSYLYSIDNYYQINSESSMQSNEINPYPMDIRKRVKIKSILNGSKNDCTIVQGLVFTKNVAHRKMRTCIDQPRILLFACSIGYDERRRSQTNLSTSQFKLTLFDSMRLQESDYISNLVAKIGLLKPDVIFVQGTVSQTALELLRQKDITVVLNVKSTILERISFFTNAELIHSPEMILNTTRVGACQKFLLKNYQMSNDSTLPKRRIYFGNKKTLMFLEGCIENIGCSVILRGSSRFQDFKKLKKILHYMMFVHFNCRLEKAFHQSFNCLPISEKIAIDNGPVTLAKYYQAIVSDQRIGTNSNNNSTISYCNDNSKIINENMLQSSSLSSSTTTKTIEKISRLTTIEDFSDPLRSAALNFQDNNIIDYYQNNNNNNSDKINELKKPLIQMQLNSKKLETILNEIPLSCSPLIRFNVPFLMSENIHRISSLRFYYPIQILPSKRLFREVSIELGHKSIDNIVDSNIENDDFANYSYLFDGKQSNNSNKNESSKLLFLNLLTSRYMIVKPHPFFNNDDYDFNQKNQQFISDFRACGPYLRYAPDFFFRNNEQQSNSLMQKNANESFHNQTMIECLSNPEHQNISVLFSVFSLQTETAFNYCLKPKILAIDYYGNNDMSLGSFLIRHFFYRQSRFNQSSTTVNNFGFSQAQEIFENTTFTTNNGRKIFCPNENCHISMFKHLMRFTHHNGTITVYLNKLNESRNVTMPHKILTWTYCTKCQSISEYTEMSADSLAISFGKFLELKFYGNQHFNYQKFFDDDNDNDDDHENDDDDDDGNMKQKKKNLCRHSLHKESYQFFSYDQLVVIFKYEPIVIYEIVTPSPVIPITRNHFSKSKMIDDLKQLTEQCHEVFAKVKNEIEKIRSMINGQCIPPNNNANVETINLTKLDEFLQTQQKEEIDFNKKIKEMHFKLSTPELDNANVLDLFHLENNVAFIKKLIAEIVLSWNDRIKEFFHEDKKRNNLDNKFITSIVNRFLSNDSESKSNDNVKNLVENNNNNNTNENNNVDNIKEDNISYFSDLNEIDDNNFIESSSTDNQEKSPNKLSALKNKMLSKVAPKSSSSLAATSDTIDSSSFTSKIFSRNIDDSVIIEMPFDNNNNINNKIANKSNQMFEHYQLPTYKDISIIVRDRDPGSIISYSLTTPEYEQKLSALKSEIAAKLSTNESIQTQENKINESVNSATILMATATITTTASTTNKNEQTELTSNNKTPTKIASIDQEELNQHIDIQFNDVNAKFYCCIYFAELFRKFRSLILVDGDDSARYTVRDNVVHTPCSFSEELYIYSLANCMPWNAVGGKSGSTFLKTRDERFILKEVTKGELKHFLTFVRDYIDYCESSLLKKCPSAFVKVVGVYQISYKNTLNNKGYIHYILVMENLFYECNVSYIYDLKGSMRNRKIDISSTYSNNKNDDLNDMTKIIDADSSLNSTLNSDRSNNTNANNNNNQTIKNTATSTVLLDENLRQISIAYPLYVHVHSKIFLMEAINRDSEFLKKHCVMDYSLLVGFDEEHNEFVVGIIDYVRLFNWEKVLENRVKKLANAIDPTVVHPSAYQKRFLDAINDYFTQVPDKWYTFMQLIPLAGKFTPDNPDADNNNNNKSQQQSNCDIINDNNQTNTIINSLT
uniref:1-phosphatidylinositol-3-phosphate 5-kinase n=1 Tax=Dermatophagoides pteronyssinus TaxID=6956 RepID=A0A6P6XWF8_DERPT|nr:1-phosphatidylinositol 3-phosphate 5-kinase-like [Dermatophagoides pteronyssinus]